MGSLIPGFEYDIFISYRQKDNKGDRWVSEFVKALVTELEATFKEDISIFFDENPTDGLLETHLVEDSLRQKLKCLIFIPVLSQTYCDSKSYAWNYEFCLFNRLAKEDKFGRDIRLAGGNVSSRILPVKIHDLDPEDKSLLESETGTILRSIDFIYKSPGVNRPLRAGEDHPQDNLNRTYYIDQINKVANAVKEIIHVIKNAEEGKGQILSEEETDKTPEHENIDLQIQHNKGKLGLAVLTLLSIFIIILLTIQYVSRRNRAGKETEKTIAVLPFKNLSNDSTQLWFCDGFVEDIRNNLQKVNSFIVRSKLSSDQYRDAEKSSKVIGKELDVNYLVGGSVSREGDNLRIWVHLTDSKVDKQMWSNDYNKPKTEIFTLQSEIAHEIVAELNTVLSPEEKNRIEKSPTKNTEAYNLYKQGRFLWNNRTREGILKSIGFFEKAINIDPNYALAYAGLADAYYILSWWGWYPRHSGYIKAKESALQALKIDKNLADAYATLGSLYCWSDWNWKEAEKELKQALVLDPYNANAHQFYSELLDIMGDNQAARSEIELALKNDPFSTAINATSALYLYHEGKYTKSVDAYNKTLEINPGFSFAYIMLFDVYSAQGEDVKAFQALQMYLKSDTLTIPLAGLLNDAFNKSGKNGVLKYLIDWQKDNTAAYLYLAKWNAMLGNKSEALKYLTKMVDMHLSVNSQPENLPDEIPRINNSPVFESLRAEPEFGEIVSKMGLSEYRKQ